MARYTNYVHRGGTLILNTAYLGQFPGYTKPSKQVTEVACGKGHLILYGPDFCVNQLAPILQGQLAQCLPVKVSPDVQYLVNLKPKMVYVTLINNSGVTKQPKEKPVVDPSQARIVHVTYTGRSTVKAVRDIKNHRDCATKDREVSVTLPPGELAILEFSLD